MRRPFVIAHISDLHLDGKGGRFSATGPLLSALTSKIKDFGDVPTRILLVTGDLLETPDKQSMQEADQFLKAVTEKAIFTHVVIIAGNHDVKTTKGVFGWKDDFYDRFKAPRTTDTIRRAGLELILLDSNKGLLAKGKVTATSYDEMVANAVDISENLREEVRINPDIGPEESDGPTIRVLALHHHPLPLPEGEGQKVFGVVPDEPFMYMVSSATFLDAAMSLGVSLILHGHRHVTGLSRYSVPSRKFEGASGDFWQTVYVLSCPSSTGADCDAGFNIISLDGFDRFERTGYELSIYRYTRRHNAGAFEPLDRAASGGLQFPIGGENYRDIALQIQDEVLRAKGLDRHQVAEYAKRSLARKAFLASEENAWPYAFYAYVVTYKLWGRPLQHLFNKQALEVDSKAVLAIVDQLTGLVGLAASVLGISGKEQDAFRSRAQLSQRDFIRELPNGPAVGVDMEAVQRTRREYLKAMDNAAAILCGSSLGLGTFGRDRKG